MRDFRSAVSLRRDSPRGRRLVSFIARISLGTVFIYAGAMKFGDPLAFADSIASFKFAPNGLVNPLALGIPPFEIICGSLLGIGLWRRAAALAILIATAIFTLALLAAQTRGLVVDCGCFGSGLASVTRMRLDLLRDLAILMIAALVYADSGFSRGA
jgi:putative oxidoreductase